MTDNESTSQKLVLLPVDRARIVIPDARSPTLLLKHIDGETIYITEGVEGTQGYTILRDYDAERNAEFPVRGGDTIQDAIIRVTDMQAFGAVRGGLPTNIAEHVDAEFVGGGIELEPLDRGGLVYRNLRDLPITLRTVDNEYWRVRLVESGPEDGTLFTLEHRSEAATSWDIVETRTLEEESETDQRLVRVLANRAGIPCLNDPTAEEMRDRIDDCDPEFVAAEVDSVDEDTIDRLAIQDRTVPINHG